MNINRKKPFIHFNVHSEYSMDDGLCRIKDLVDTCVATGMPSLAITDRANLHGAVKFYTYAISKGIKPIIGVELYLQLDTKLPLQLFTLFCENKEGYYNLNRLLSDACLNNPEQATVTLTALTTHKEGLILVCNYYNSIWNHSEDNSNSIKAHVENIKRYFPQRFYLALQRLPYPDSETQLHKAVHFAAEHELPPLATNDVLFIDKDHFHAQQVRHCIGFGKTLAQHTEENAYQERYLKSPAQMQNLFNDIPEALENTIELAKCCNLVLPIGESFLPQFIIENGVSADMQIRQTALSRLNIFLGQNLSIDASVAETYHARLQWELDIIVSMGFSDYFLIVADFIQWAKNNGIPVGPGRGSGAGSLAAFVLGITTIDPIKYALLFERFLNPERVSLPDFDVDFCIRGRDRVIRYVREKYGDDRVCQIITFGHLSARAVLRDVGRVLSQPYPMVDRLAKMIPGELGMTLQKALDSLPALSDWYDNDQDIRLIMDTAIQLEGLPRNCGTHAGGVVIAPDSLTNFLPLCKSVDGTSILTQYDKDDAEAAGLVKFDFLGLKTLTIIHDTLQAIETVEGIAIDIDNIPLDDPQTFALLSRCETLAVFQLESRGIRELIRCLQPDHFEEIIALVALYRPGPLQSGMVDDFIARKHGHAQVRYLLPELEPILAPTYGVILYQEQVMQIAQVLAGYTLGGADLLRRAMGKKKAKEMAGQRSVFLKGATQRGIEETSASHLFDLMEKFAAYGFNRSHSAAYAMLSYQTAWLKAHYPGHFMAAVLSVELDDMDKIATLITECRRLNLAVSPPSINDSSDTFLYTGAKLYYGLAALKGVGKGVLRNILQQRREYGRFENMFDFVQRCSAVKLSKSVLGILIKAGALDSFGINRRMLYDNIPTLLGLAAQQHSDHLQESLFSEENIQQQVQLIQAPEWAEDIRLKHEKSITGVYLSGDPYRRYRQEFEAADILDLSKICRDAIATRKKIFAGGRIASFYYVNTQSRGKMAIINLDDESAAVELVVFSEVLSRSKVDLQKDAIIFVNGSLGRDERSGEARIYVAEILLPETMREQGPNSITLKLSATFEQSADKARLKKTLRKYIGG